MDTATSRRAFDIGHMTTTGQISTLLMIGSLTPTYIFMAHIPCPVWRCRMVSPPQTLPRYNGLRNPKHPLFLGVVSSIGIILAKLEMGVSHPRLFPPRALEFAPPPAPRGTVFLSMRGDHSAGERHPGSPGLGLSSPT